MNHLACIMDGNRRWARQHNVSLLCAYQKGMDVVRDVIRFSMIKKIPYVSLFVFSLQNVGRTFIEKQTLYAAILTAQDSIVEFVAQHDLCVVFVGDLSVFPDQISSFFHMIEQTSKQGRGMTLVLFLGYGGQEEIVSAAKRVAMRVAAHEITPDQITSDMFKDELWTAQIPDPDLIIRTGKVCRLSNFFLYKAAYAELYCADCLWPDITINDLQAAYDSFFFTKRSYGL